MVFCSLIDGGLEKRERKESDILLFQLLQRDCEQAFTIIYKQYVKSLYSLAYKYLKSKEMAEDAIHHVFCKLWEHRSTIDVNINLKNYLYSSVKNYILNEIRNNNLAIQKNYELAQLDSPYEIDVIEQIEEKEMYDLLKRAMDSLPEQKRQVCYYKIYDELSNQEIADKMNVSVNTIKTHYSQSLKLMRTMLKKAVLFVIFLFFR